ncbi:hypothetical protein EB1_05570 [Empedobacter brevis NBRC 14943 = ATCC 43319]|uniref:Uncharacterized protein n=1 Tax=Empedobacter brevis NBRC 14943 = ATCC 43319 TaxID=1218108 RepID=A0A511NDT8_9FLAO|nr:hypothetical protein [Empedobacter brevis]GEM50767.1 hypothetical protein EB1_05570 [Empedobacter brevis NBRC 14943 = ATCC 43319]
MHTTQFIEQFNQAFNENGRKLIQEFFISFSRFEYALKASDFINGNDRITRNWDAYVVSISSIFDPTKNEILQESVNYLIENPPKIQAINENGIIWSDRNLDQSTPIVNKLRLHISDVRNNLFHGGKFNGTFSPENSRNYKLLQSCLIILNEWIEISPNIKNNFSQPIE